MPITRREALLSATMLAAAGLPAMASAAPGEKKSREDAHNPEPQTAANLGPELSCLTDFEAAAKSRVSHMAWEFFNGAAADEITMRWNLEAYQRIRLKPRVLVDVSKLDTRVNLFGQELAFPIILAPTAYHKLAHPEGELATARGAGAAHATMVVSTVATTSIEDIAKVATQPLWFQLYVQRDRGFTRELVQRAEAAGRSRSVPHRGHAHHRRAQPRIARAVRAAARARPSQPPRPQGQWRQRCQRPLGASRHRRIHLHERHRPFDDLERFGLAPFFRQGSRCSPRACSIRTMRIAP